MPRNSEAHRSTGLLGGSLALVGFLAMVGWASYLVMKQRGMPCEPSSVAIATLAVACALIPPLWFDQLVNLKAAGTLVTVMWRLGVLLPAIVFTTQQTEPVRNCMQGTLLACYLMTLPLESWLLIRQTSSSRPNKLTENASHGDQPTGHQPPGEQS